MRRVHPHSIHRSALALCLSVPAVLGGPSRVEAQEAFIGTVVYETSAGGSNTDGAVTFTELGPRRESVTWGSGGRIRLETEGGMSEGVIVARMANRAFFHLDPESRTATPVRLRSLNREDQSADVLQTMGQMFAPAVLERTEETGTYAGHACRMYIVRSSLMLRRGATARACVAEHIQVRPSRYGFEWNDRANEQPATLPLQFDMREGLPLMLEVNENDTLVTYTAVSVTPGEPDDALFSVPRGYTVTDSDG
ncbi:MAG TPA: hypothetical protein VF665_01285 [Longimicrobium sp.]|jgi:hypothetical protein|uniref:hypothetical protein n=1 Tax=Longimicrobium sp. TaxID=2029185 RepID=UPI002EDB35E6